MVKVQQWLEENRQNKNETKEIYFTLWRLKREKKDVELEGEALIDNYPNLEKVDFSSVLCRWHYLTQTCENGTYLYLTENIKSSTIT